MKTEELREELREKKDLLSKLIEMWKNNASVDETLKVIKDAGFDISYEEVEKLLASVQAKQAKGVSLDKLDLDELSRVSGGGEGYCSGTADCDYAFNWDPEETNRCGFWFNCDEITMGGDHCTQGNDVK